MTISIESQKLRLVQRLEVSATQNVSSFYEELLDSLNDVLPSAHSLVWSVNTFANTLSLLSQRGADDSQITPLLDIDNSITGLAWSEDGPKVFPDLSEEKTGTLFKAKEKAHVLGLKSYAIVPVFNNENPIILAFYQSAEESTDMGLLKFVAHEVEIALNIFASSRRNRITTSITKRALLSSDPNSFSHRLVQLLKDDLRVQGVSIFLWDRNQNRLVLSNTTGVRHVDPDAKSPTLSSVTYESGEGKTGSVFLTGNTTIIPSKNQQYGKTLKPTKWFETVPDEFSSFLAVPIEGQATNKQNLGVIRCANKLGYGRNGPDYFSQADVALLKWASMIAGPYLRTLQHEKTQNAMLKQLSHEVDSPIVSIRGTADLIITSADRMPYQRWIALCRNIRTHATMLIMRTANYTRLISAERGTKDYSIKELNLLQDVILPCIDMSKSLCREEYLQFDNITYDCEEEAVFRSDSTALVHVLFNLLTNAVKYHKRDNKKAFKVHINCYVKESTMTLSVSDYGTGIQEKERDLVFEYGFRGTLDPNDDVQGMGIGLNVARIVVQDLGGTISVARTSEPTTFLVSIPEKKQT